MLHGFSIICKNIIECEQSDADFRRLPSMLKFTPTIWTIQALLIAAAALQQSSINSVHALQGVSNLLISPRITAMPIKGNIQNPRFRMTTSEDVRLNSCLPMKDRQCIGHLREEQCCYATWYATKKKLGFGAVCSGSRTDRAQNSSACATASFESSSKPRNCVMPLTRRDD